MQVIKQQSENLFVDASRSALRMNHVTSHMSRACSRQSIIERATQLYNTLQQPAVAAVALNAAASPGALSLRHDDANTSLAVIRAFAAEV